MRDLLFTGSGFQYSNVQIDLMLSNKLKSTGTTVE